MRRPSRSLTKALAAVLAGGGLALAIPALPAVGQSSPPAILSVEVTDQATLVARGAAVAVPVELTCPADTEFAGLSVQVHQRVGNRIARGFDGTSDFTCTGSTQVVTVVVPATELAFKKGTAFAEASLFVCGPLTGCVSTSDTETIAIVR